MRIKLDGHVLMFGDVLITKPQRGNPFVARYAGGEECTVAKLDQPSQHSGDPGRVRVWSGRRSTDDGRRLMSSYAPHTLAHYFTLADAPHASKSTS